MTISNPDYSLYLVTDSTMVPDSTTFLDQVKNAVDNGATIVQLREKDILTLDFIIKAQKVLEITRPKGIPLIINDRVDVALAVDADGVHVGQDDMPAKLVRQLIGKDKILGVSCTNEKEISQVCEESVADYVGLGTLYPTNTKNVKNVCGPIGIRKMLKVLSKYKQQGKHIKSVAIGGINRTNATKVMFQCQVPGYLVDGVAVVSDIMASEHSAAATSELLKAIKSPNPWIWEASGSLSSAKSKPLVHHITNNVVKNFSANVTLAIGASPIMSELAEEFDEFAALPTPVSLVVNLGTPSSQIMDVFLSGVKAYNNHGRPIVFDPVAAGASKARLEACRVLLNAGYFSVIKGNLGEIMALDKLVSTHPTDLAETLMQGVDLLAAADENAIKALCVRVAKEFRAIVVVTGQLNYIYDGTQVHDCDPTIIKGGSVHMGLITGTGCSLGSVIAAKIALAKHQKSDLLSAVEEAVTIYNQAGELAAKDVSGSGSFMIRFLDELSQHGQGET